MPSLMIRREPNPPTGVKVTVVRAVAGLPVGAHAELLGSFYRYDEVSPLDVFEVEYKGRIVTVQRADLR